MRVEIELDSNLLWAPFTRTILASYLHHVGSRFPSNSRNHIKVCTRRAHHDIPLIVIRHRVSSTLDKSVGKKYLIDGSPETCWTSQQVRMLFNGPIYPF